jgi:hypothetical protein
MLVCFRHDVSATTQLAGEVQLRFAGRNWLQILLRYVLLQLLLTSAVKANFQYV